MGSNFGLTKKLYTFIIISFPILSVYSSGISSFTFADIAIFIALTLFVIKAIMNERFIVFKPLIWISILIFAQMILIFFLEGFSNTQVLNTMRYITYLLYIGLYIKFFSVKLGYKMFKVIVMFASFFIYLQVFSMKILNIYIFGYVPFLPLSITDHKSELSHRYYEIKNLNRPYSIFEEPSHFSIYVILFLAMALFGIVQKEKKITLIFISIAVLLSQSYTGILILIILILFKCLQVLKKGENIKKNDFKIIFLGITISMIVLVSIAIFTSTFTNLFSRFNYSLNNRVGASFSEITDNFSYWYNYIIGVGIKDLSSYFPAITRTFIYFGLIGFTILYLYIIYHLIFKRKYNKVLLLLLFLTTLGTEILYGKFMVLYMPFIICTGTFYNNLRIKGEENEMRNGYFKL